MEINPLNLHKYPPIIITTSKTRSFVIVIEHPPLILDTFGWTTLFFLIFCVLLLWGIKMEGGEPVGDSDDCAIVEEILAIDVPPVFPRTRRKNWVRKGIKMKGPQFNNLMGNRELSASPEVTVKANCQGFVTPTLPQPEVNLNLNSEAAVTMLPNHSSQVRGQESGDLEEGRVKGQEAPPEIDRDDDDNNSSEEEPEILEEYTDKNGARIQIIRTMVRVFFCRLCQARCSTLQDLKDHIQLVHHIRTNSAPRILQPGDIDEKTSEEGVSRLLKLRDEHQSKYGLVQNVNEDEEGEDSDSSDEDDPGPPSRKKRKLASPSSVGKCSFCYIDFSEEWRYTGHMEMHANERFFSCNYCQMPFPYQYYLQVHLQDTDLSRPDLHKCQDCSQTFGNRNCFLFHRIKHDGLHRCTKCEKPFPSYDLLKTHILLKHNPSPFVKCLDASCRKLKFLNTAQLNRHTDKAHKEGIHCPRCHQLCKNNFGVKVHMRNTQCGVQEVDGTKLFGSKTETAVIDRDNSGPFTRNKARSIYKEDEPNSEESESLPSSAISSESDSKFAVQRHTYRRPPQSGSRNKKTKKPSTRTRRRLSLRKNSSKVVEVRHSERALVAASPSERALVEATPSSSLETPNKETALSVSVGRVQVAPSVSFIPGPSLVSTNPGEGIPKSHGCIDYPETLFRQKGFQILRPMKTIPGLPLPCFICTQSFSSIHCLNRHLARTHSQAHLIYELHDPSAELDLVCPDCQCKFNSFPLLLWHAKRRHNLKRNKLCRRLNMRSCDLCYYHPLSLPMHKRHMECNHKSHYSQFLIQLSKGWDWKYLYDHTPPPAADPITQDQIEEEKPGSEETLSAAAEEANNNASGDEGDADDEAWDDATSEEDMDKLLDDSTEDDDEENSNHSLNPNLVAKQNSDILDDIFMKMDEGHFSHIFDNSIPPINPFINEGYSELGDTTTATNPTQQPNPDEEDTLNAYSEVANRDDLDRGGAVGKDGELKDAELKEADELKEAKLKEAKFKEAELKEAELKEAEFKEAELKEANLKEAKFKEAELKEAKLKEAKLKEAELKEAELKEAELKEAELKEAELKAQTPTTPGNCMSTEIEKDWEVVLGNGLTPTTPAAAPTSSCKIRLLKNVVAAGDSMEEIKAYMRDVIFHQDIQSRSIKSGGKKSPSISSSVQTKSTTVSTQPSKGKGGVIKRYLILEVEYPAPEEEEESDPVLLFLGEPYTDSPPDPPLLTNMTDPLEDIFRRRDDSPPFLEPMHHASRICFG